MEQKFVLGLTQRGFHKIAYYEWGARDAAHTIVCVHGLTRNAHDFDKLAAALAAQGCRVLCVDVPGRGASDNLPDAALYGYPQYCADMAVVLARSGAREVSWVGTSMGGLIGMALAAQPGTPIRRLLLNDVGPFLPASAMARIAAYISAIPPLPDFAAAETYIRKIYQRTGPCSDEDYRAMTQHSLRLLPKGGYTLAYDPAIARNFAAIKGDVDLWRTYDAIRCPTLVLRGALSDVLDEATAQAMTQRGPRAQLVTIPDIGHYPALMDEAQIALARAFLLG